MSETTLEQALDDHARSVASYAEAMHDFHEGRISAAAGSLALKAVMHTLKEFERVCRADERRRIMDAGDTTQ